LRTQLREAYRAKVLTHLAFYGGWQKMHFLRSLSQGVFEKRSS
jgi:hypothetical protein